MFVIFDGEAEFTVDGRTSLLKGTVGAPVRMGHSHAIYNPGKTPVEFMNINVSAVKGKYDAFDLDDARVGAPKDEKPVFMTMRLDKKLLQAGRQIPRRRRHSDVSPGARPERVSHKLVVRRSPRAASGRIRGHASAHRRGGGLLRHQRRRRGSVGGETTPIHKGDAVPLQLSDPHAFRNTGNTDLEFMILGIAAQKGVLDVQEMDAAAPARGAGPSRWTRPRRPGTICPPAGRKTRLRAAR